MPQNIIDLLNTTAAQEKRRGGAPDGVLNFSLQGVVLPDEEHDDDENIGEDTSAIYWGPFPKTP